MLRRLIGVTTLALATLVAIATPAWAHTELEPEEATAGSTETLTFHVAYEDSATTGLDVELPEGASVVDVPEKTGWTSASDTENRIVSWTGGPVEADETFDVVVALPATPGVLLFPAIQHTTDGEVSWIDPEEEEGHDSFPAPRITLIADPSATTSTTGAADTASTSTPPTTADLPATTVEAANEGDGDSAAPWLIGAGIAAVVAIVIGGLLMKRRADADQAAGAPTPDPSAEAGSDTDTGTDTGDAEGPTP